MTPYAVEVENLSRHFGSFKAVDSVTLRVDKGEIFGFLGANGAGKTTTIRMLCGLLVPTAGQGRVAGWDIRSQTENIKRSIGYMSQRFSLYPDLTGRENLAFYGAAYGLAAAEIRDRVRELSDHLSLDEFLDSRTQTLPTGWRQRLALAGSLLHRPRLLFLDEPTGGVDPVFRRQFWSVLYELADGGVTVFVTTHYMDEAEYCGRIVIMHAGRIVETGKPPDLIRKHGCRDLEDTFIKLITRRQVEGV